MHFKRILIVSNNPLSETRNNGKTLLSLFKDYPQTLIRQIYIENSLPDLKSNIMYYRVTDNDNVESLLKRKKDCGICIQNNSIKEDININSYGGSWLRKTEFAYLIRELIWKKKKWQNDKLNIWLEDFNPEIIFFYAGDSVFMYDVVEYICNKFNCSLSTYISDDYVLHENKLSLYNCVRKKKVLEKMKKCVSTSQHFFTISNEMRIIYKELFGKDSQTIMNSPNLKFREKKDEHRSDIIRLIYCGSLEYGRLETLVLLAKSIKNFNMSSTRKKAFLDIYSLDKISDSMKKKLSIFESSMFNGGISSDEVINKIESSDILVHVESFNKKNIEYTKLSISTKIADYISSHKAILAIGPQQISSMLFLSDTAYCIYGITDINNEVKCLLTSDIILDELESKSKNKYYEMKKEYSSDKIVSILLDEKED